MEVCKSTDGGITWLRHHLGSDYGAVRALAVSPFDSNLLLAGGWIQPAAVHVRSCVFRSSDAGAHWIKVAAGIFDTTESSIMGIAFDPADPSSVLATTGERAVGESAGKLVGVYRSTDAGLSWSPPQQSINATCITTDPGTPGRFFVGSSEGIWVSYDHGLSWRQINHGLPTLGIFSLTYDPVNRFLYAGTDGRGVARLDVGTALGVAPQQETLAPTSIALCQNYPNPFNPSTTIRYGLPERSHVSLAVYNTLGQQVAQLVNGEVDAGYHDVTFDASNLPSGIYFYRLQVGGYTEVKKLLLLR